MNRPSGHRCQVCACEDAHLAMEISPQAIDISKSAFLYWSCHVVCHACLNQLLVRETASRGESLLQVVFAVQHRFSLRR